MESKKILFILILLVFNYAQAGSGKTNEPEKITFETKIELVETIDYWDCLTKAIIWQESRNIDTIQGATNDVGIFQITPIYIVEVNRIVGYKKYKLEDRTSREKSMEMFTIMQGHHNPEKNIFKAIKLHNPLAPPEYKNNILEYFAMYVERASK